MNLIGKKVLLRELRENDMEFLNSLMNNKEVESNVVGWSKPVTMSEQLNWFKNLNNDQNIRYAISDLKKDITVGTGIISKIDWKNRNCSLDIKLDNQYQQKGFGSESISLMIDYVFNELNMNSINIKILDYNIPSQKAFEKNGFIKVGTLKQNVYKQGKYNDIYIYELLKEDYERNRK